MNYKKTVSSPSTTSSYITCRYINETSKLQVIRTANVQSGFFERTLFAGQQLMFDIQPDAVLEVNTCEMPTAILTDRIPCIQLRYTESISLSQVTPKAVSATASSAAASVVSSAVSD